MLTFKSPYSRNSKIVRDETLDSLKTRQSQLIPVFANNALPSPLSKNARQGDIAFRQTATDGLENTTGTFNYFDGTEWVEPLTASEPLALFAVDSSGAPNSNGASIVGVNGFNLNRSDFIAGVQYPGILSTGAQTIGGIKTFSNAINIPNTLSSTVGLLTINGDPFLSNYSSGANKNIFLGSSAGNFTTSGSFNIGIGQTSLDNLTSGTNNVALGTNALAALTTGTNNVALGTSALSLLTTGTANIAVGTSALNALLTGTNNIVIGNAAGQALSSTESGNIIIGSNGAAADANTIRLGSTQTKAFIAGIATINPGGTIYQVGINSSGQLGTSSTAGLGVNNIGSVIAGTAANEGASLTVSGLTTTLNLEAADGTHNGVMTTSAQTFSGNKTFINSVLFPSIAALGNSASGSPANGVGQVTFLDTATGKMYTHVSGLSTTPIMSFDDSTQTIIMDYAFTSKSFVTFPAVVAKNPPTTGAKIVTINPADGDGFGVGTLSSFNYAQESYTFFFTGAALPSDSSLATPTFISPTAPDGYGIGSSNTGMPHITMARRGIYHITLSYQLIETGGTPATDTFQIYTRISLGPNVGSIVAFRADQRDVGRQITGLEVPTSQTFIYHKNDDTALVAVFDCMGTMNPSGGTVSYNGQSAITVIFQEGLQ